MLPFIQLSGHYLLKELYTYFYQLVMHFYFTHNNSNHSIYKCLTLSMRKKTSPSFNVFIKGQTVRALFNYHAIINSIHSRYVDGH